MASNSLYLIVGISNRVRLWIALCESGQGGIVRRYPQSADQGVVDSPHRQVLLWASAITFWYRTLFHYEDNVVALAKIDK